MSKHIHDESDRNQQVKFRVSEDLVERFDEARDTSRAALFREFMAEFVDEAHGTRTADGEYHPEREDLATLYDACLKHANPKLVLNLRIKGSLLAQDTRYSQNDLVAALRPLESKGFVRIQCGGVFGKGHEAEIAVRVKPPEADPRQWKYRKTSSKPAGGVA